MQKSKILKQVATGRRKTSVARAHITTGEGKITINSRSLDAYISVPTLRMHALQPLVDTNSERKYNIAIRVSGGGPAGQAGAIRHALARALLVVAPETKPILREKGLLTRDSRMKERKKYGQPGARKRFQFSKR